MPGPALWLLFAEGSLGQFSMKNEPLLMKDAYLAPRGPFLPFHEAFRGVHVAGPGLQLGWPVACS